MRVRRFLHIVLLVVAGVLAWQAVATWSRPFPSTDSPAQDGVEKEKSLPPAQVSGQQTGKQSAEDISDKDLFSPSRSRAIKESTAATAVAPPSHLKLVGIVLSSDREEAFFADSTQGGKVVRVRKGDTLGSYRLAEVTPLEATLAMGEDGEEVSLPLLVLDSGTAAKGPHLMPAPPQPGGAAGRPGQARPGAVPARGGGPAAVAVPPAQNEAQAIRQNIQQLQQRLRQIRRQVAREGVNEAEQPQEEQDESGEEPENEDD